MPYGNPPNFPDLGSSHSALLIRLRDAVAPILANNLLPHYTDHSVAHSDSLVDLVGDLTEPHRQTSNALNKDELVILYSACYLHDIGLQYQKPHELGVIPERELAAPWHKLPDQTRRDLLRRYHHLISAYLVQASAVPESTLVGIQLSQEYHPARVASLCAAHCVDTRSDEYRKFTKEAPNVRMALLSALLRLADILDESRKRALRPKAKTLDLGVDSLTHWWRHYYTELVTFDPRKSQIRIHFNFPPKRRDEYARIVPELQLPAITEELERHRHVLSNCGLAWYVTREVNSDQYSTTEVMPENVLVEMAKQLRRRRSRESDAQRAADLRTFEEAQPLLRRQREELASERETLSPAEFLRRLHALAWDRWQLGGRRAAPMMLRWRKSIRVAEGSRIAYDL